MVVVNLDFVYNSGNFLRQRQGFELYTYCIVNGCTPYPLRRTDEKDESMKIMRRQISTNYLQIIIAYYNLSFLTFSCLMCSRSNFLRNKAYKHHCSCVPASWWLHYIVETNLVDGVNCIPAAKGNSKHTKLPEAAACKYKYFNYYCALNIAAA